MKDSVIWKLNCSLISENSKKEGMKTVTLVMNSGPTGNVFKTLKDKKISISEDEKKILKRIVMSKMIIAKQDFKNDVPLKQIEHILQSARILRKVGKNTYKADYDFVRSKFDKDLPRKTFKKPFNKDSKNRGGFNEGNQRKFDSNRRSKYSGSTAQNRVNNKPRYGGSITTSTGGYNSKNKYVIHKKADGNR